MNEIQQQPQAGAPRTLAALAKDSAITARFADLLGERAPSFLSGVIAAARQNAMLQKCEPLTVITAAMTAAALDLPVSAGLGYAALVPFKDRRAGTVDCQLQIMTRGYVQLALRSGRFARIEAQPVCEGEIAALNKFTGDIQFAAPTSEKIVGYLAYFRLTDGFEKFLYMSCEELNAHAKKYSQTAAKGFGLWVDNFDAMAKKTVLKLLLARWAPLSTSMQIAIERDGTATSNVDEFADVPRRSDYVDSTDRGGESATPPPVADAEINDTVN